jgi:hypothetical protein
MTSAEAGISFSMIRCDKALIESSEPGRFTEFEEIARATVGQRNEQRKS